MRILPLFKHSLNKNVHQNTQRYISKALIRSDGFEYEEKKKENFIIKKISELNEWYIQFTGLDEVKRLQDRVIHMQEKLEKAQDDRREVGKILIEVRKKSTDLQEQLHNMKRWEDVQRYLDLTRQETEVMKLEKDLTKKFEILDKTEREIFTTLSNAVRDSHEKEKAQSEYTKYWGIILSIIGTIIGAVVSTLISTIRNKQIVNGINEGVETKFKEMVLLLDQHKNKDYISNIITDLQNESNRSKIILEKLNDNENRINELIKNTSTYNVKIGDDNSISSETFFQAQNILLEKHRQDMEIIVNSSLVVGGVTFLIVGFIIRKLFG